MLVRGIRLTNFLSFGPDTEELEMGPLNVIIGPNGSGKSNFIEAFSLLQAAPREITLPIHEGGMVSDWIWKGEPEASSARIEVIVQNQEEDRQDLRFGFSFGMHGQARHFRLTEEYIRNEKPCSGNGEPHIYFERRGEQSVLNLRGEEEDRMLQLEEIATDQSILAQRRDPVLYPELTYLGDTFSRIRLYREWIFGKNATPRYPHYADLPGNFLDEDNKNLGIVLSDLKLKPETKTLILKNLKKLYAGITDLEVSVVGGRVQVFVQEGNITFPATRLSDGTLRYLCLLAILCHPDPPPLVCLEEPELGLHPDVMLTLGDLLREASTRCQLVVTTHSDGLVDTLTDTPESVVVFDKHNGATRMRRLNSPDLATWLERYTLGELWIKGVLGGNRW